ncbi:MAG: TonB-dependent receptor [Acidobacteria bacterium]|nr:TonB-dependent receptor [Acidobacteriota bacterium]NIM60114.1 TonB-dependent receptor [Acidobacteriota bacterium]NIO57783.1 TonB-dependent receptor [Acidobacteriota bacterium]NIQ28792.1 TonB-dependent receptor [Acidobacteriota bacterium]NIQ83250.1 TonB-dependent receptor [Acidobacteriota bacterium]
MSEKRWLGTGAVLLLAFVVACGGSSEDGGGTTAEPAPSTPSSPSTAAPEATTGATGTASISGSIRYDGEVPNLPPLRMEADPGCAKMHSDAVMPEVLVLGENNALGNVIVYVKSGHGGGAYPTPADAVVLDQQGCRYTPHVTTVQTGQTFNILNSDGLLHNVHGLPKLNTPFNRAMPAAVTTSEYVFDKEEIFKIKCDVHPWMGAWVGVFSHPFHGVTGTDGGFSLDGLPAGDYEIEAVHERLGTLTAQVTVADGESATRDFVFVRE